MTLKLIRTLSKDRTREWLVVEDGERGEVLRLDWTDNLLEWFDAHREQIDNGDINPLLEYYHNHK
jgi:hypothetical protein